MYSRRTMMHFVKNLELMNCSLELLLVIVSCGLIALLCWLTNADFKKSIIVEGSTPWADKEILAYKCAAGNRTSFRSLFNEIRSIVQHGRIFVLFYNGAYFEGEPETVSLYAIGFPIHITDYFTWRNRDFKTFGLKQVQSAVLVSYPLHYRFSERLAVRRIYPELCRYTKKRKLCAHPTIEIYDYEKKEVTFVQPLVRQRCFYVPEAMKLE